MAAEDQRAAVGFSVTLSSQLIAASMATLAVEGAYLWYALGSRQPKSSFVFFAALAAILIVASIYKAGKGITEARNAGFDGKWDLTKGKQEFNTQATLLLGALAMLGVMFSLSGESKESAMEQKLGDLRVQVALLQKEIETQMALREVAIKDMAVELGKNSKEIQALQAQLPKAKRQKR